VFRSHPASTSQRGLTANERFALEIEDGTIRLSVDCEPVAGILQSLDDAMQVAVA
jgi:O-acetylhomoserine/O-acetylserine sulfhydrylase-like pyridoxal-dependent enzyme